MTDITIPPEALEAAYNARRNGDILEDICLAMLKHWSGMHVGPSPANARRNSIILPLPQKETR